MSELSGAPASPPYRVGESSGLTPPASPPYRPSTPGATPPPNSPPSTPPPPPAAFGAPPPGKRYAGYGMYENITPPEAAAEADADALAPANNGMPKGEKKLHTSNPNTALSRKLLETYFRTVDYPFTRHHIDSFDQFLSQDLPAMIKSQNPFLILKELIPRTNT